MNSARAQSEMVGTILLISVVIIAVSTFGVFFLGSFTSDSGPLLSANFVADSEAADGENLTVAHAGGETVAVDELSITVTQESTTRYYFDAENESVTREPGSNEDVFAPGDRWRLDDVLDPKQPATIRLIHDPSGTVVDRGRIQV